MRARPARGGFDSGRPTLLVGTRRVDIRSLVVTVALTVAVAAVTALSLASADLGIAPANLFRAIVGQGDRLDVVVVRRWRGPRVLMAAVVGALLGMAGAIFQTLTRNVLGSPDVIGFTSGVFCWPSRVAFRVSASSSAEWPWRS